MFTLPHLNMRGVGRIRDSNCYSIPKRRTRVCINVENSSSSSRNIFWENIYHQRKTTSLVFYWKVTFAISWKVTFSDRFLERKLSSLKFSAIPTFR